MELSATSQTSGPCGCSGRSGPERRRGDLPLVLGSGRRGWARSERHFGQIRGRSGVCQSDHEPAGSSIDLRELGPVSPFPSRCVPARSPRGRLLAEASAAYRAAPLAFRSRASNVSMDHAGHIPRSRTGTMRRVVPSAVLLLLAVVPFRGQSSAQASRLSRTHITSLFVFGTCGKPLCLDVDSVTSRQAFHSCDRERPGQPAQLPPELYRGDGLQYTDQRRHERRHLGQVRVWSSGAHGDIGRAAVRGTGSDARQGTFPHGRGCQRVQFHQHPNCTSRRD